MMRRSSRVSAALWLAASLFAWAAPGCSGEVALETRCEPHERELCYGGPPGTEGVGPCRPGLRACADDGSGFGACEDEVLPGVEDCAAPGDEDCDGQAGVCTGDALWARRITGTGYRYAGNLALDGAGNVSVAATFAGDLALGPPAGVLAPVASYASCAFKLDAAGDLLFGALVDGDGFLAKVAADAAGNTVGVVNFQSPVTFAGQTFEPEGVQDVLLYKLDANGKPTFAEQLSASGYTVVYALSTSPAGDILLGGDTSGTIDFGGGDIGGTFLVHLDPSGAHVFSKELPPVQVRQSLFDANGNIFLSGYLSDTANFGGDTLVSVGQEDSFVVKLGPSGEHLWSKAFGSSGLNHSSYLTIAPDGAGNLYLGGYFSDTWDFGGGPVTAAAETDAYLAKLDPNGDYLWGKYFGSGDTQGARDLAVDAGGNVVLGATFLGTVDFGSGALHAATPLAADIAVAKFTANGDPLWSKRFGDGNNLGLDGLRSDAAGNVFLVGSLSGAIDFGSGVLPATGDSDIFVAKLAP